MNINLTKLLDIPLRNKGGKQYEGEYGMTSWVGKLEETTGGNSPYSFEIEEEVENGTI